MSTSSAIEWTDELGHKTASAVAAHVVAADEASRPPRSVEQGKALPASAFAINVGVWLTGTTQIIPRSVLARVLPAREDLKVLPSIVKPVTVDVVDDLASTQQPTQHLGRHETVFVDVPSTVRHRVAWLLDQHVATRGDRSAALPLGIHGLRLAARFPGHTHSVATGR